MIKASTIPFLKFTSPILKDGQSMILQSQLTQLDVFFFCKLCMILLQVSSCQDMTQGLQTETQDLYTNQKHDQEACKYTAYSLQYPYKSLYALFIIKTNE